MEKIVKNYCYKGLGFPVYIDQVTIKNVMGDDVADLDEEKVQRSVILALCSSAKKLTGNQIKFMRLYFEMSQEAFGALVDTKKQSVSTWEKTENQATGMDSTREEMLKLKIIRKLMELDFIKIFDSVVSKTENAIHDEIKINLAS